MGGACSRSDDLVSYLNEEDLEEVKIGSCFTRKEIRRLYDKFRRVDKDNSNTLSVEEFMNLPQFKLNPLAFRLAQLLDPKETGAITFRDFVHCMSSLSPHAPSELKMKLAFQIYDVDGDGGISESDLAEMIKTLTSTSNVTEDQIAQVVENVFTELSLTSSSIPFEEFAKVVAGSDLDSHLTVQF